MFIKNKSTQDISLAFRDIIFSSLFIFVVIVFFILPWVNPVGEESQGDIEQPGFMFVELIWPPDNGIDIDLIIRDPNGEVTFFRNTSTKVFDLLRDDRGSLDDDSGLNYEHAFSRSLPDGIYTINAFVFSLNEGELPVQANLIISIKDLKNIGGRSEVVIRESIVLNSVQEERTIVRFMVLNGKIIENSKSYYTEEILPPLEFSVRTPAPIVDDSDSYLGPVP
jgi:hypothetical protein